MKELELRTMIRGHVKKIIKEAGPSLGAGAGELERGLGKISARASKLSKRQRIKAVIPVLQKFGIAPNDMAYLKAALKSANGEATPEPEVEENYTAGVDDGKVTEGALDAKGDKLEQTQAFQMLQKALASKPAGQQAEFVLGLIGKLGMKDSAKRKLKLQVKQLK
jgi:hypothetical protein